jgi:Ca2+-binding EF-hand superfamily protein
LLDKNQDGKIDEKELKNAFDELGRRVKEDEIKGMLGEVDGPMNFNNFLAMFGERLSGTDDEQMLFEAFKLLDDKGQGQITKGSLKELLTANGRPSDRLSEAEV